jgi:hypothetical protein
VGGPPLPNPSMRVGKRSFLHLGFWLAGFLRGRAVRSTAVTTFYPCRLEAEHHMLLAPYRLSGTRLGRAAKFSRRAKGPRVGTDALTNRNFEAVLVCCPLLVQSFLSAHEPLLAHNGALGNHALGNKAPQGDEQTSSECDDSYAT